MVDDSFVRITLSAFLLGRFPFRSFRRYLLLRILLLVFLAVPLASGQVHSSTSHSVTELLSDSVTDWLSDWVIKLKISVNIDARTLKFGMEHPWAHWLRFRKNQFEGPCKDHVLAIKEGYSIHPAVSNLRGLASILTDIFNFMTPLLSYRVTYPRYRAVHS